MAGALAQFWKGSWRPTDGQAPANGRRATGWALWATLGLVALAAGMVVPQLLPADNHVQKPATAGAAKSQAEINPAAYAPPAWPDAPDPKAMLLRLGGWTVVVLLLCVGSLFLLRRGVRGQAVSSAEGGQLAVVESLVVGNRCTVYLLRAGRSQVLAGVDGAGLKALIALPESFETALTEARADEPVANAPVEAGQVPSRGAA